MRTSLVLVCLMIGVIQGLKAQDQNQWRGPNRDGIYPDTHLLRQWPDSGLSLVWEYDSLGRGFSSPVFDAQHIYMTGTIDSTSYLYVFDTLGNLQWKKSYGPEWMTTYPGVRPTITLIDSLGYILSGVGVLYCLDVRNGKVIWSTDLFSAYDGKNIQHGITENLIVDGDKIYCTPGGTDANVIALNRWNGQLIWKSHGNGRVSSYCTPILIHAGGKQLYVTMTAGSLIAINTENGDMAWSYPLECDNGIHANAPLYRDGYLFVIDGWQTGCKLFKLADDGNSVSLVWKSPLMDDTSGHAILIGDNLYGSGETAERLFCLDWLTGTEKFSAQFGAPGTLIYADSMLYSYTYGGVLSLIQPMDTNFVQISKMKIPGNGHFSHPVIHHGKLYVRFSRKLWAYDIKQGQD